jgi:chemotaxis protein methyltransferase CheR
MTIAPQRAAAPLASAKSAETFDPRYRHIRDLVYKVSGIYKAEEKLYLLADGCGRRMKQMGARTPREYWDHLTALPGRDVELRHLLNEITIGETSLFRSQPQLDALRKIILPEIVTEKSKQITKRLRIWSAGCSTGEESYTLAMNMLEERDHLLKGWTFYRSRQRRAFMASTRCATPRTTTNGSISRPSTRGNCKSSPR